ncbi:MAG: calcium-binding protein, partial [Planktothrix sp.]
GEFQTLANFSANATDAGDANLIYDPETGLLYYIDQQGGVTPLLNMGQNLTLSNDNFDLI